MPMQATTTVPLFSAALRPDRSPRIMGGWVAFVVATVLATPFALVVPEMLVPVGSAFFAGGASLSFLSVKQSRRRRTRQQVTLWAEQLEVVTSNGKGDRLLRRFDPRTVRLVLDRDNHEKVQAMRLNFGKDQLEIGPFLSQEDKASFAQAFGTALRKARHHHDEAR